MRLDRRLMLLGVLLVVLSTTMATQYATTKATYSFTIVHPSESDIRYIGSDNSSHDSARVLRVSNNSSGSQYVTLEFGHWMPDSEKTYTAAFGIVNEESVPVNITHIDISGVNATNVNLSIWLHGNRTADASTEGSAVLVVENATAQYNATHNIWTLAKGDGNRSTMSPDGIDQIPTPWDTTSHVRYSVNNTVATSGDSDYVWVQVSLNIAKNANLQLETGTIYIYFKADSAQ